MLATAAKISSFISHTYVNSILECGFDFKSGLFNVDEIHFSVYSSAFQNPELSASIASFSGPIFSELGPNDKNVLRLGEDNDVGGALGTKGVDIKLFLDEGILLVVNASKRLTTKSVKANKILLEIRTFMVTL